MITVDNFRQGTAPAGFYFLVLPHYFFCVEVDAEGNAHQLKPSTLERDGILPRDGWSEVLVPVVHGPFVRLEKAGWD